MPLLKVNLLISKRIHPAVVPIERHLYHALVSALKSAGSHEVWSVQSSDNEHTLEVPAGIIALARAHCSALDTGAAEWSENSLGREMQVGQAADKWNYGVNINQETNGSYPTETAGPKCWIALHTCAGWQSRRGDPDQNLGFCSRSQGDTFTTSEWPWLFWLSVPPRLASTSIHVLWNFASTNKMKVKKKNQIETKKAQFSNWEGREGKELKILGTEKEDSTEVWGQLFKALVAGIWLRTAHKYMFLFPLKKLRLRSQWCVTGCTPCREFHWSHVRCTGCL